MALPEDPCSRDIPQSPSPRLSTSRGTPGCDTAVERRGGGLHAQRTRAMPSTLPSSSLLGDPSQIKQQLEITEPLIHAAGAELARGCRALSAGLRRVSPPPIEPSLLPRFDPARCPQPRRGHPTHRTHGTHGTAPPASHSIPTAAPRPPGASPAPRGRLPPLRLTSAGHGRARRGDGHCCPARSRAAASTERGQRLPGLSLLAGEEPGYSQPLVRCGCGCGVGGVCGVGCVCV